MLKSKSPRPPEVGVLNCDGPRDKNTGKHCDSRTESAQWASSVKIDAPNINVTKQIQILLLLNSFIDCCF